MSQRAELGQHLVAFDLETTGLSPKVDRILEIGAVRYDASLRKVAELEVVVDPGMPIPLAVQRLTGIGPDDVAGAPAPAEGVAQFADFCDGAGLIAHGGNFDMLYLASLLPNHFSARLMYDTLELARILLPSANSHSLPLLSADLGLDHARPHRALSDASATGALFARLLSIADALPAPTLADIRRVATPEAGPLRAFFADVVKGSGAVPRSAQPASASRPAAHTADREAPTATAAAVAAISLDSAAAVLLGPHGPVAQSPSYEYREAQLQMARAVGQTLERKRRLLVEAGTGVGKSLAYLVPLALWAARSGGRAVVATHTVNLQEQLAERDLPLLEQVLPEPVSFAILKGRNHYLSLRRWVRFLHEPDISGRDPDIEAIRFKLKVLVWLTQTRTGDRSELRLAAGEEELWQRVASDTDDCLGRACANWGNARCYMVASRRAAADAAIVVTNHALLLADSERQGQVLASYSALVVDEAHHLEAVATQQLGARVRALDIALILDRLPVVHGGAVAAAIAECAEASRRLFGDAKGFMGEQLGGEGAVNGTVALSDAVRASPGFVTVLKSGRHAVGVLDRAVQVLETQRGEGAVQEQLLPQPDRVDDELALAAAGLGGLSTAIDRVVCNPRPDYVAWVEMRAEQAELHDAPVSVAAALREHVFERTDATILTSATLSVGGSFDFIRQRVGIGDMAEELTLPSSFDYLAQALCVLPDGVPSYDDPAHEPVMASLINSIASRLDGHTLVLFTGYGPLKRVYGLLHGALEARGIAILGQGIDGTRRQILQNFLNDPRTVLLGTSSFWEGVDIPGERLRCVVIDKLPFPVPTDPLVRARTALLSDPFTQYVLPVAVLRLRQGFGRLIRSQADRGAVVLCDERLSTRDYGPRFLEALPPAGVARTSVDGVASLVEAFVERGVLPEAVGQSSRWSSNENEPA